MEGGGGDVPVLRFYTSKFPYFHQYQYLSAAYCREKTINRN